MVDRGGDKTAVLNCVVEVCQRQAADCSPHTGAGSRPTKRQRSAMGGLLFFFNRIPDPNTSPCPRLPSSFLVSFSHSKQAPTPAAAAAFSGFAYEGGRVLPSSLLSEKLTVHGGRRVADGGPRWYSYRSSQPHAVRVPS